ncbi:MAG: regulator of chromosome condensation [Solirubrobacterales bacterium]|nr:regulator of chromosome condensation [Solirubrobacterales bacterium]
MAAGVLVVCLVCCAGAAAAQISAGGGNACLVISSGRVDCWGNNESGQLGNGTTANSDIPVEVHGVTNAIEVSAGLEDSCVLLSSGHVDCWGSNDFAALGDGTRNSSDTPVEVRGLTNAIHVAVGSHHACAVLSSGHVDCWGAEAIEHIVYERRTPVEVPGIDNATQVAAGGGHSCALLSSGHVECWEENGHGQLGDGSTRASEIPVEVHGIATATEIAAGSEHSCALLSSGHVDCWGTNAEGQLGDGKDGGASDIPVEVQGVTNATQIAAGEEDSCALMSNSHVDCWGANYYGQLGNGTIKSSNTAVEVQGVTTATQVAAGGAHSCVLLSGGHADCWGDNESEQLGDGTNGGNRVTPVGVQGLSNATQVATGYPHSCAALSSGHVACWGENALGQLGDGTTERSETPVEVHGVTDAMQVSAGEFDSCAVLRSGHVDCWGGGAFETGQLGNGTKGSSNTPVEVKNLTNATQVATSTYGSCALLSSGHVDCWGNNEEGELGDGEHGGHSDTPVEVQGVTDATQVAAGEYHFCAVLSSGHVDCWGSNISGELGDGTEHAADRPVEVHGLTDATQVAAGYEHSCAVLSSGHVDCWGANYNGQLGDGTNTGPGRCAESRGPCSKTPVEVQSLTNATRVTTGGSDSCALLASGHVDCWGGNLSGQLGDGTAAGRADCEYYACWDTPVEVQGLTDAIQIAAGGDENFAARGSTCAVLSSGQLDCWGSNANGALGDDLAWSTLPVGVAGFSPAEVGLSPAVATGGSSTVGEGSASVAGSVNPEGMTILSCVFEYGPSASYGHSVPCSQTLGSGKTPVAVSAQITGLDPGTLYHYRLVATNSAGTTYGSDHTFTTLPEPSRQVSGQSSSVTGAAPPPHPSEQASGQSTDVTSASTPSFTSLLSFAATASKNGKLSLAVSCSHGRTTCIGTILITLIEQLKHHKGKTVRLASTRYILGAASSARITMTLSSLARAQLARSDTLRTSATITTVGGATHTTHTSRLTIHAAKR